MDRSINQDIRVELGYKEFYFKDIMKAVNFARTACSSIEDKYSKDEVRLVIDFKCVDSDDSEEVQDEEDD